MRAAQAGVEETGVLDYAGQRIEYCIRRSARRRSIGLSISAEGAVIVAAPPWVGLKQIHGFVREKAAWLLKHKLRLEAGALQRAGAQAGQSFAEGEMLPLLGEQLVLRYVPPATGIPPRVWREGTALFISGLPPEHSDEAARREAVRRALEEWYKAQALDFFTAAATRYSAQLGLGPPRVRIGSPQQRWGSCNARGELRFNWRLLLGPRELADYVAAHEVSHRLELNHSLRFWRVVARLLPDFKHRERRLDELGPGLYL